MRFSKSKKVLCSNPRCQKIAKHIWLQKTGLNRRIHPRCDACNYQSVQPSNIGSVVAVLSGYSVIESCDKGFTAKPQRVQVSPIVFETMGWKFHRVK